MQKEGTETERTDTSQEIEEAGRAVVCCLPTSRVVHVHEYHVL